MIKEQVYSRWAFTENEKEKAKINYLIYQKIKDKAEIEQIGSGYAHDIVKVTPKKDANLSLNEKALIADSGNLCFGYSVISDNPEYTVFKIYTD